MLYFTPTTILRYLYKLISWVTV